MFKAIIIGLNLLTGELITADFKFIFENYDECIEWVITDFPKVKDEIFKEMEKNVPGSSGSSFLVAQCEEVNY